MIEISDSGPAQPRSISRGFHVSAHRHGVRSLEVANCDLKDHILRARFSGRGDALSYPTTQESAGTEAQRHWPYRCDR
jgi:hypothetical protein